MNFIIIKFLIYFLESLYDDMFPCSPSMIAAFKCFLHCWVTFTLMDLLLSLITITKLWFSKWLTKDLPSFIVYNLIKGLPEKSTFWCTASSVLFLQFPRTYTIHFVSFLTSTMSLTFSFLFTNHLQNIGFASFFVYFYS